MKSTVIEFGADGNAFFLSLYSTSIWRLLGPTEDNTLARLLLVTHL